MALHHGADDAGLQRKLVVSWLLPRVESKCQCTCQCNVSASRERPPGFLRSPPRLNRMRVGRDRAGARRVSQPQFALNAPVISALWLQKSRCTQQHTAQPHAQAARSRATTPTPPGCDSSAANARCDLHPLQLLLQHLADALSAAPAAAHIMRLPLQPGRRQQQRCSCTSERVRDRLPRQSSMSASSAPLPGAALLLLSCWCQSAGPPAFTSLHDTELACALVSGVARASTGRDASRPPPVSPGWLLACALL
jgi:hypothetical protein